MAACPSPYIRALTDRPSPFGESTGALGPADSASDTVDSEEEASAPFGSGDMSESGELVVLAISRSVIGQSHPKVRGRRC